MTSKRIIWIDVLRGILILLMVLGHATGKFNAYIYQFHIGAFFLLSGFTESLKEKSVGTIAYRKAKRILLPYVTMFFTLLPITILIDRLGYYEAIFGSTMPGVGFVIREFLLFGRRYVWWLGACWFLPVLFYASICVKLLTMISKKYYLGLSAVLYLITYLFILPKNLLRYRDFDLVLLAQFYFCCGFALKDGEIIERVDSSRLGRWIYLAALAGGVTVMAFVSNSFRLTMDWPDRRFNSLFADFAMIIAGFSVAAVLAKGLSKTGLRLPLIYIGKNTMGIVMLHFVFMKAAICVLYLFGKATVDDLSRIVPTEATGNAWYLPIVVLSVGLSLLTYRLLCAIPGYKVLLGMGKRDAFLPEIQAAERSLLRRRREKQA